MEAGLDEEYNRLSVACSWIGSDEGNEVSGEGYAFGSLLVTSLVCVECRFGGGSGIPAQRPRISARGGFR